MSNDQPGVIPAVHSVLNAAVADITSTYTAATTATTTTTTTTAAAAAAAAVLLLPQRQ